MEEEWRPVPSIPGVEASSLGRIRRTPHFVKMPHGGLRRYGGKAWFGVLVDGRYQASGIGRISRAICEAFHGPAPFPGAVAMHEDENSMNNKADNILWGTQKENLNAPGFVAYCRTRVGQDNPRVKGMAASVGV